MPNYQRFLLKNFQARAQRLGWLPHAGESDEDRLLRPALVGAVARFGGDRELADEARTLADRWLADHSAIPGEVVSPVLVTAAYYGDLALYNRFFTALLNTQDTQSKERLVGALTAFHDRAAIESSFQAALAKRIPVSDGFLLLLSGRNFPETRTLSFDFVKQHYDELLAGHPSIFGNDLGSYMPYTGGTFCDAQLREQYQAFFAPRVDKSPGAPRDFAQMLEGIDLCIARKSAQGSSVEAFLGQY